MASYTVNLTFTLKTLLIKLAVIYYALSPDSTDTGSKALQA